MQPNSALNLARPTRPNRASHGLPRSPATAVGGGLARLCAGLVLALPLLALSCSEQPVKRATPLVASGDDGGGHSAPTEATRASFNTRLPGMNSGRTPSKRSQTVLPSGSVVASQVASLTP